MGYVRVAFGALNVESQCSWAVVQSYTAVADMPVVEVKTLLKPVESSWTRLRYARCCDDKAWGSDAKKTVEVPQVQYSDRVVDVPAAVHRQCLDVPVRHFSDSSSRS